MSDIYKRSQNFTLPQLQLSDSSKFKPGKSYSSLASDEIELVESNKFATGPRTRDLYFGGRETQADTYDTRHSNVREKSWRLPRRRLRSRLLPGLLAAVLLFLLISMVNLPEFFFHGNGACSPDGDFAISYYGYTPWKSSGLFAINIKVGSLTFWQAKFLDLAWDVVNRRCYKTLNANADLHWWSDEVVKRFWLSSHMWYSLRP